jgi:hypothetical protein
MLVRLDLIGEGFQPFGPACGGEPWTPSAANALAIARPMPMLAPVTSAVLPLSSKSMWRFLKQPEVSVRTRVAARGVAANGWPQRRFDRLERPFGHASAGARFSLCCAPRGRSSAFSFGSPLRSCEIRDGHSTLRGLIEIVAKRHDSFRAPKIVAYLLR